MKMPGSGFVAGALFLAGNFLACGAGFAGTVSLEPTNLTVWKAVYANVVTRETIPARARIGGLVVELSVTEGDLVTPNQQIALVRDDKIDFQIAALDAQIEALQSQLATAETELERGQELVNRGVATVQRLDQLRTSVEVIQGQIASVQANRDVIAQQRDEGKVLAPSGGRVLTVPVTPGAVIVAGEPVAVIGGGGFFLRLAVPERHASDLQENAKIKIVSAGTETEGRIAKIYPQIENGRVFADVDFEDLATTFVNARVLVHLPVAERMALIVPLGAAHARAGIDFVTVADDGGFVERVVVLGEQAQIDGAEFVEVITGLVSGDKVVVP